MLKKIVWCLKEECADNLRGMLPLPKEGMLYLSDNAEILAFIQSQGCYTVAVYHEGVSGILSGTQYAVEGTEEVEWEYLQKVYRRFAGKPWDITQTDRCTIREMSVADVDDLYELYDSPLVTRYMEGLCTKKEQEIQYIQDYIKNVYEYYDFGIWLIHRKEDGQLIGRAGFYYRPGFEEVELGFLIGQPYWRRGYAYEVCSHLMEMGKSIYEFDKVQAVVKKENMASVYLLKKLGFHFEEEIVLEGEECHRYLA